MLIIPAIDIKNGKCVRLTQGKFERAVVYGNDPVEMALRWVKMGAKILHIVDLDGAKKGFPVNIEIVRRIRKQVIIPLQVGGGINTELAADELISSGVDKIILGTVAIDNPLLLKKLLNKYSKKVIVSMDAKNGKLMKRGWLEKTGIDVVEKISELEKTGVKQFIFTDVAKDGTLTIPNYKVIKLLRSKIKVPLIAAGGISTVESLRKLREMGLEGAIVGKAIYEGKIDLKIILGMEKSPLTPL